MSYGRLFSVFKLWRSNTKWVRAINPGAGLEMWYKSTAWPPQHSTPLNIQRFGGRVGSARVNLSQCKVILLWLPGACVRAQTHKQFYQTAHGVLGKGICSGSFFITNFLSSGMWTTDLLAFTNRKKPPLQLRARTHGINVVQRFNINLLQEELERQEECLETTD